MARSWITPKTNWTKSDKFTITDYNRIRNNLLYINDVLNEKYPDKAQTLDLGDPVVYSSNYYPRQFNAFEDALESFTRAGGNINIGSKKTFKGNDPFIDSQELNRIEGCCLRWYNYDPIVHVSSISISPKSQIIKVGETGTFDVTCLPANAEEVNSWIASSSNTSVVTVAKNGANVIATGVSEGTATINVSAYKSSDSALINVESVKVTQIILDKDYISSPMGQEFRISYQLIPSNATNKNKLKITTSGANIKIKSIEDGYITAFISAGNGNIIFEVGQVSAKAYIEANTLFTDDIFVSYRGSNKPLTEDLVFYYAYAKVKQWVRETATIVHGNVDEYQAMGIKDPFTVKSSNPAVYDVRNTQHYTWDRYIGRSGTSIITVEFAPETGRQGSFSYTVKVI